MALCFEPGGCIASALSSSSCIWDQSANGPDLGLRLSRRARHWFTCRYFLFEVKQVLVTLDQSSPFCLFRGEIKGKTLLCLENKAENPLVCLPSGTRVSVLTVRRCLYQAEEEQEAVCITTKRAWWCWAGRSAAVLPALWHRLWFRGPTLPPLLCWWELTQ